jgi:hypothetical protein
VGTAKADVQVEGEIEVVDVIQSQHGKRAIISKPTATTLDRG